MQYCDRMATSWTSWTSWDAYFYGGWWYFQWMVLGSGDYVYPLTKLLDRVEGRGCPALRAVRTGVRTSRLRCQQDPCAASYFILHTSYFILHTSYFIHAKMGCAPQGVTLCGAPVVKLYFFTNVMKKTIQTYILFLSILISYLFHNDRCFCDTFVLGLSLFLSPSLLGEVRKGGIGSLSFSLLPSGG